ncbi:MAG TPA: methyltransferase domain-containing protein [Bryobacteraceae bacterium]|nr:methyltransferase domain-containing protein [Bryobacteraceae bacterium]
MSKVEFDEKLSRRVEAIYTTPDVVAQRAQVLQALRLASGEHVLDIGAGPGLLAYDMARSVGPTGRLCGIDASPSMIAMASKRCAGQPWVEFRAASATELPYPDASFDVAVSTQVYEYVSDIPAALAELHRVLRPDGRAVILDTDSASLVINTEAPARMARVLSAWEEHFVHPHLPRTLSRQLRDAGFEVRERASIPMFNPEFENNTYGKGMLEIMAEFVVGRQGISQNEADAWFAEFTALQQEGKFFFSLNRYLFVAVKHSAA